MTGPPRAFATRRFMSLFALVCVLALLLCPPPAAAQTGHRDGRPVAQRWSHTPTAEELAQRREYQAADRHRWEGHCHEVGQLQCVGESIWGFYSFLPLWGWLSIAACLGTIIYATRRRGLRIHHRAVQANEDVDVTAVELAIHAAGAERLREQVAQLLASGRAATLHIEVAEALLAARDQWALVAVRHWDPVPNDVAEERKRALVAEITRREDAELPREAIGYRGDGPVARDDDPEVSLISFITMTRVDIPAPSSRGARVAEETLRSIAKVGAKDAVDVSIHFTPAAAGDAMRASEMLTRAPRLMSLA